MVHRDAVVIVQGAIDLPDPWLLNESGVSRDDPDANASDTHTSIQLEC